MLVYIQQANFDGDFMQILRRFHADFTQKAMRNRNGIVAES